MKCLRCGLLLPENRTARYPGARCMCWLHGPAPKGWLFALGSTL